MANILRVSDAASLAMHAMVYLAAKPDGPVTAAEIAETLHASEAHLAKVFSRLAHEGLVISSRGPKGGFVLSKAAGKITLHDVYAAIEGRMADSECLLGKPVCHGGRCILGGLMASINEEVRSYLDRTVLSDLISVYEGVV